MTAQGFAPNIFHDHLTERQWQNQVIDMAVVLGWVCHHETDSRKSPKGFPDIVACHPQHGVIFLECKKQKHPAPFTIEQRLWISTLQASGQVAAVVQPSDGDWVEAVLRGQTREIPDHRRIHLTTL